MRCAKSIAVVFFFASLAAVKVAFASEDDLSRGMKTEAPVSLQSGQTSNVLRQVATALAGSGESMRALHGAPYEDDNRDRLQVSIPGMDCGIDRILSYVSCYSRL